MPRIQTTCGACFTRIRLDPTDLELHRDGYGERFVFTCPVCGEQETRPADSRHLAVLGASGMRIVETDPRPAHPEAPDPHAPALTRDDLLAFHEMLATDDWLAQLR